MKQNNKIKYQFIMDRVPKEERKGNLFYYEVRGDYYEMRDSTIEREVLVDFGGTLITNKEILENKEYICIDTFCKMDLIQKDFIKIKLKEN